MTQRSVLLQRSQRGYGFNLAGEFPCYLSAIQPSGVAARAGLAPGDRILCVNGHDVQHWPHRDIARLVGCSGDRVELTVCAPSDDEGEDENSSSLLQSTSGTTTGSRSTGYSRSKSDHALRSHLSGGHHHNRHRRSSVSQASIRRLRRQGRARQQPQEQQQNSSLIVNPGGTGRYKKHHERRTGKHSDDENDESMPSSSCSSDSDASDADMPLSHGGAESSGLDTSTSAVVSDAADVLHKAVVLYIGAMPVFGVHASKQRLIRNAIETLRRQRCRRVPTVLLNVRLDRVEVLAKRSVIARIVTRNVTFVRPCTHNRLYFAIAATLKTAETSASETESSMSSFSNSNASAGPLAANAGTVIHVFSVDPRLRSHVVHARHARRYRIACTRDRQAGACLEFPDNATALLHALCYVQRRVHAHQAGLDDSPLRICSALDENSPLPAPRIAAPPKRKALSTRYSLGELTHALDDEASDTSYVKDRVRFAPDLVHVCRTPSLPAHIKPNPTHPLVSPIRIPLQTETNCQQPQLLSPLQTYAPPTDALGSARRASQQSELTDVSSVTMDHVTGPGGSQPDIPTTISPVGGSASELRSASATSVGRGSVKAMAARSNPASTSHPELCSGDSGSGNGSKSHSSLQVSTHPSGSDSGTAHSGSLKSKLQRLATRPPDSAPSTSGATASGKGKRETHDRVESWATDFEILLQDPSGLFAFMEFCKKHFCSENVTFWIGCENYSVAQTDAERVAREIYDRHFADTASEPVNVDSKARVAVAKSIQQGMFERDLFLDSQKQIFHLMKYDTFPRFLKSEVYRECLECTALPELREPYLKNVEDKTQGGPRIGFKERFKERFIRRKREEETSAAASSAAKRFEIGLRSKKAPPIEQQRRMSLPPNEMASLVAAAVSQQPKGQSQQRPLSPAHTTWPDLIPQGAPLFPVDVIGPRGRRLKVDVCEHHSTLPLWTQSACAAFLPDDVLHPEAVDVVDVRTGHVLQKDVSLPALRNRVIEIRNGVEIRLHLSGLQRQVVVRASPDNTAAQVLRPALNSYAYCMEKCVLIVDGSTEVVPSNVSVGCVHGKVLNVMTQEEFQVWINTGAPRRISEHRRSSVGELRQTPDRQDSLTATSSIPQPVKFSIDGTPAPTVNNENNNEDSQHKTTITVSSPFSARKNTTIISVVSTNVDDASNRSLLVPLNTAPPPYQEAIARQQQGDVWQSDYV